jgi:hypothetical protein
MCTFIVKMELSLSDDDILYDHSRVDEADASAVCELDVGWLLAPAFAAVQSTDANLGLDVAMHSIASPTEVVGGDGRMVTELLHVEWTATNPTLVCFSYDRIEWLHHTDA